MSLQDALLEAHAAEDRAALVRLYTEAADAAQAAGETDRACFFLTHAFVFALEIGDTRADGLKARLVAQGREVET